MYCKIVLSLLRGGVVVVAVAVVCTTAGAAEPPKLHVGLSASFALSGGGALWVTDRVGNQLIRVDPAAGRVKWRLGIDRKSTRLNSSHVSLSRMPSSA